MTPKGEARNDLDDEGMDAGKRRWVRSERIGKGLAIASGSIAMVILFFGVQNLSSKGTPLNFFASNDAWLGTFLGLVGVSIGALSFAIAGAANQLGENAKRFNFLATMGELFVARKELREEPDLSWVTWRAKKLCERASAVQQAATDDERQEFAGEACLFLEFLLGYAKPRKGSQTGRADKVRFENLVHGVDGAATALHWSELRDDRRRSLNSALDESGVPCDTLQTRITALRKALMVSQYVPENQLPTTLAHLRDALLTDGSDDGTWYRKTFSNELFALMMEHVGESAGAHHEVASESGE